MILEDENNKMETQFLRWSRIRNVFFFFFRTGFRPTNGEQLIRLMCRGMRSGQALFPLEIEPGIPRVRP